MKKIFSILSLAVLLFACSSEDDNNITNNENEQTKIDHKLQRLKIKESTFSTEMIFEYGENEFVKSITSTLQGQPFKKQKIIYNDKNQVIEAIEYDIEDNVETQTVTETYSYNTDGFIEKSKYTFMHDPNAPTNIDYTYENGLLKSINESYGTTPTIFNFEYTNNNKKLKKSFSEDEYTEYTFGDKKSPYIDIFPEAYRLIYFNKIDLGFNLHTYSDKNIISVKRVGIDADENVMTYNTFNEFDKPTSATASYLGTNEKIELTYIYE